MALMSPTLDPSQQDQYRQRMQPMDQPSVASPGGAYSSPRKIAPSPAIQPGALALAPRPAMSPVANPALRNLANQRVGEDAALSALPASPDPGVNAARAGLIAKHEAFASPYLHPSTSAGASPAPVDPKTVAAASGMYTNILKMQNSVDAHERLNHDQIMGAVNTFYPNIGSPAPRPSLTSGPGAVKQIAPPASPASASSQPAGSGTITMGPGWGAFAGEARATLHPELSPSDISNSVQKDFTDLVKGEKANVKDQSGYLNTGSIAGGADDARNAVQAQKNAQGAPSTLLHRLPVADGTGYAPFVKNLGETFVHTGGGGYESERGRVMRVGPDGKQIGQVSQGPRPQNLGIKWDSTHDALYNGAGQPGAKPPLKDEQVGSSANLSQGDRSAARRTNAASQDEFLAKNGQPPVDSVAMLGGRAPTSASPQSASGIPASLPPAQHGTTKVVNGHTYRANEQTRQWEPVTQ